MKKKEFIEMFSKMIQEEFEKKLFDDSNIDQQSPLTEVDHTPQYKLYRYSPLHPINVLRRKNSKLRHNPWTNFGATASSIGDTSSMFGKYNPDYHTLSGKEILPDHIREYLKQFLFLQKNDPVALKILQGQVINKVEAARLAKILVAIPSFLMKQPRNVAKYLRLMSSEGSS